MTRGKDDQGPEPDPGGTWAYHQKQYGEDFDYQDFAPQFRAELFDPDQWADVFAALRREVRRADLEAPRGLRPVAQREASATWGRPWNAVEIGPKRDLLGDLTEGGARARA